nr:OstA-like protein [Pedobacter sp. SYSU D00535]
MRPIFTQEGSTLAADSAYYNQNANTFDAFGNVVITQPGGTTVYADLLNYFGNTRLALLTGNVRLVDKEAVLTTNYLTYNMGTKIGTYVGGGQIVNGPDVLTSRNGYYFANSRDAYFRYDVKVNTPDALITTDTLKYNSGTRVANFYGPTNIKGKRDQTNLYTENGRYNTLTDQAWFGKKNLYTEGTKSLRGDSLYYDGKVGFGKAINNITFIDTEQKITLKGDQGIYRKKDESALVTRNAYVILQTEQDSAKVDSVYMAADTLLTKMIFLRNLPPVNKEDLKSDQEVDDIVDEARDIESEENPIIVNRRLAPADTAAVPTNTAIVRTDSVAAALPDSIASVAVADTLQKEALAQEEPQKKKKGLFGLFKKKSKETRDANAQVKPASAESRDRNRKAGTETAAADSLKKDSVDLARRDSLKSLPLDTTRTRIVLAYRKVKIFKSDLQAKSDSAFYAYADSTIRCYYKPMMWTQGSQLSGDTVFLQLKNKKLDNMLLKNNGLIVSTELDSSKFNQVKGKLLTGLFRNNQLSQMFVDGNAESIYYTVEDSAYSGMNRALSSRMRLEFSENKLKDVMLVRKPEGKYYPINKIPKDTEILEGFVWKPNERPKSKEEIIPSARRRVPAKRPPATPKKPIAAAKATAQKKT